MILQPQIEAWQYLILVCIEWGRARSGEVPYPYSFDYNAPNVPGPGPMQVGLHQNQAGNVCTADVENHTNLQDAYFTGSAMVTQIGNSGSTVLDAAYRQGGQSHTQFGEPDQIIATPTNPGDFSFVSGCRRLEAPLG